MIVPSLPVINETVHVLYSGCKTKGKMKVVGSGYFRQFLGDLCIHERFYIAKPDPWFYNDYVSEWLLGTTMTEECDSGACVTTLDDKIHSFVIGKRTGPDQFRLLSPAHFVLEQIKTLTEAKKVKFVKCESEEGWNSFLQSLSKSFEQARMRSVAITTSDLEPFKTYTSNGADSDDSNFYAIDVRP